MDFDHPPRGAWPELGQPQYCGSFRDTNRGIDTWGQTMAVLCNQFSAWLNWLVIDKTGISGRFDIHLALSGGSTDLGVPAIPPDPLGAISSAVRELGLELKSVQAPVEALVIDHMERPSEN